MKNSIHITALESKAYFKLHKKHPEIRYKDLRKSDGLTIKKKGLIYIRLTPDYDNNKDTLHHEMMEMMNKNSPDEVNGVRYKKWGKFFKSIFDPGSQVGTKFGSFMPEVTSAALGLVPGVGPLLATGYGAYAGADRANATGSNPWLGGTMGAISGYGMGSLGAGLAGGVGGIGGQGFIEGAKSGMGTYLNTPGVGGLYGVGGRTANLLAGEGFTPQQLNAAGIGEVAAGSRPYADVATLKGAAGPQTTSLSGYGYGGTPSMSALATGNMQSAPQASASYSPYAAGSPLSAYDIPANSPYSMGSNLGSGVGEVITKPAGSNVGNFLKSAKSWLEPTMTATGLMGGLTAETPEMAYNPEQYIQQAKSFQKLYGLESLPMDSVTQLKTMVEADPNNINQGDIDALYNPIAKQVDDSVTKQVDQLTRNFVNAGYGQRLEGNQEYQRLKNEIIQNGEASKQTAKEQATFNLRQQIINAKQWAVNTQAQTGQFDINVALSLAEDVGMKDELENSIKKQDYANFQKIMSQLLSKGLEGMLNKANPVGRVPA